MIYVRVNILRNRTLLDRMDNGICGSRCDRFHIDVERGGEDSTVCDDDDAANDTSLVASSSSSSLLLDECLSLFCS